MMSEEIEEANSQQETAPQRHVNLETGLQTREAPPF